MGSPLMIESHTRMHRRLIASLALGALCVAAGTAHAQQPLFERPLDGPAIGVFGGIVRGDLDASFNVDRDGLVASGPCGEYSDGTTAGFVAGVFGEVAISHVMGIVASAGLVHRDAEMRYPCVDPAGTRMPDGSVAAAVTEFRADARYDVIALDLGIALRPFSFPLVGTVTPSLAYCASAEYSASERIVTPVEASFVDGGGQERAIGSGAFEAGDIAFGIAASVGYEARIARGLFLVPRVGAFVGLSDEIAAGAIRSSGLSATLGLFYRFASGREASSPIEAGSRPVDPAR